MVVSSSTSNYRVKKETRRQYEAISSNLKMARPELDLHYGTVKCDCLPQSRNCVIRVVTDHEKPNKGRLFYTCDHCGFFLWCHPLKAEFRGEPLPIDSSVMGRFVRNYGEFEEESYLHENARGAQNEVNAAVPRENHCNRGVNLYQTIKVLCKLGLVVVLVALLK